MLSRRTLAWSWTAMILSTFLGGFLVERYTSGQLLIGMTVGIVFGMALGAVLSRAHARLIKWPDSWI